MDNIRVIFVVVIDLEIESCILFGLDYQPQFGKMSPHSSKTGPGRRRKSSLHTVVSKLLRVHNSDRVNKYIYTVTSLRNCTLVLGLDRGPC